MVRRKRANEIISKAWHAPVSSHMYDSIFRFKLKNVKESLKNWSKQSIGKLDEDIRLLGESSRKWEIQAESRHLTENERVEWLEVRNKWLKREQEKRSMLKQARIKWAVKGDENSKFFHSVINRRNNKNNIRGLHINGLWNEKPMEIKEEVHRYFKTFYEEHNTNMFRFAGFETRKISDTDALNIEAPFTEDEIVAKILSIRLRGVIDNLIGVEQSAFVKGKSILDSILIGNELVDDVKRRSAKCCIFKADFEKAFDSVNWEFLLEVMGSMGFGIQWRRWMETCLRSASISILVDGSPTKEFNLQRGI
ncbi:uncharacterized protein [Rutidosis leptorrhynchoides]|uniref:uncharacterized protein n=1 Tax=Rutidosis leptorrhynchoides TaxID=125765 RepID=UPI003A9A39F5